MAPNRPRAGRRAVGPTAAEAWTASDNLLQRLAGANSMPRDWAEAMQGVQTLEALMDQLPQPTWPQWLLPRLCAAVARGLQPPLLGMSGQPARSAVLYEASTRSSSSSSSSAAQKQVLHALCGVGELMCRLAEVLHAAWKGEAQQLRVADAEFVRLVTVKSGLMPALGTAAGYLASFVTKHKALKENAGGSEEKEAIAYCMTAMTSGMLNLWVVLHDTLPEGTPILVNASPAISQTVQPIITLAATMLQAYPGPPTAAAAVEASSARAAEMAREMGREVPQEQLTAGYVYQSVGLPQAIHVAAAVSNAVSEEAWSRAIGSPGSSLNPDTPRSVLQLLLDDETKYLLTFAVLVNTTALFKWRRGQRCLDPKSFPTSVRSSSRRSKREARQRRQQQRPDDKDVEADVEAWHQELEKTMGLTGCMDKLLGERGGATDIDSFDALVAIHCCVGASLAARGEASIGPFSSRVVSTVNRVELLPRGLTSPLMKVVSELLLMEADMHLVLFGLQLLQGIIATVKSEKAMMGLVPALVGALGSHIVQGVRTADGQQGWRALDNTDMDAENLRGSLLEAAGNFMVALLDPSVAGGDGLTACNSLIVQQPTVMLSTLDALLRTRAETEAASKWYIRRLQLYHPPPGITLPEMLRLMALQVSSSTSRCGKAYVSGGDGPVPSAPAAFAVLDHPATTGAAWVGLLVTAQKYALRSLHVAPALCAWEVAASAVVQMLAIDVVTGAAGDIPMICTSAAQLGFGMPVMWTAAVDAASLLPQKVDMATLHVLTVCQDEGSDESGEWEEVSESDYVTRYPGTDYVIDLSAKDAAKRGANMAQRLGPLLLPIVQLYCRALLLLTKVLLLPEQLLSPGMAIMNLVVEKYLREPGSLLEADAVVTATYITTQFLELLLPQLVSPAAAAAAAVAAPAAVAAADSGSSAATASSSTGRAPSAVLPADVAQTLQQQAAKRSTVLRELYTALAGEAKEPTRNDSKPAPLLLSNAQKAFARKTDSSSTSGSGGDSGASGGLLLQLQQLALDVLAQLPTHKMCANPNCVQMGCLSERELCEKRCSACKTAYCSKECSRSHWKTHKPLCKRLTAAAVPDTAAAAAPAEGG